MEKILQAKQISLQLGESMGIKMKLSWWHMYLFVSASTETH